MTYKPASGAVPPFQDLPTLAWHTSLGESTIERMVKEGRFPQPRKKKAGKNLWLWSEVYNHLAAQEDEAVVELDRIREATRRISHAKD